MGHARAIAFVGSAGRWVAASWACCGPGAAPAGGEWRCVAGVYRFHGGGGAMCSGVGWARGRLPAGSGCRGLTVGGSSAVSPCCVPWWYLVGWLKGVFGVYRIHGGTIVYSRAAAGGAVGCGGGACVGVVRVVGGGASWVVLGGSSRWSVVVVPGGWSWAWRFLGGCGTCGVGLAGGGGARVCGPACLPSALPAVSSSAFSLLLSFCLLVLLCFFLGGGWLAGVLRFWCRAWVWVCAGAGASVGVGVVGDGGRVAVALWVPCVCAGPQASGFQGAGPGGADGGWLAAVVAWRLRGWSRLLGSAWVVWPGAGVRVGVFMAWADGVVGSVGVAGLCGCRVCVRPRGQHYRHSNPQCEGGMPGSFELCEDMGDDRLQAVEDWLRVEGYAYRFRQKRWRVWTRPDRPGKGLRPDRIDEDENPNKYPSGATINVSIWDMMKKKFPEPGNERTLQGSYSSASPGQEKRSAGDKKRDKKLREYQESLAAEDAQAAENETKGGT